MPRYVILRHELPSDDARGLHWDLMLESGKVLRTWALEREPVDSAEILASQLADHRLAYLDYEGEIPGKRGFVTRWDAGEYRITNAAKNALRIVLDGSRIHGPVTLVRHSGEGHSWRVSFAAAPTSG